MEVAKCQSVQEPGLLTAAHQQLAVQLVWQVQRGWYKLTSQSTVNKLLAVTCRKKAIMAL